MDDISNIQDNNLGGLKQIKFAPWQFFTNISAVAFKAGCDWITVECTKETMLFTERRFDDVNGGYIDTVISGAVPHIRPDITAILAKYALQPVVVQCEDNNDLLRLAGVTGRLILIEQASTGTDASDLNGYQVQFTGRQLKNARFL